MTDEGSGVLPHELDVTVWVGKGGIDPVVEEIAEQLKERAAIKVKFLRSARAGTDTSQLADDVASRVDARVIDVRGHTAVLAK